MGQKPDVGPNGGTGRPNAGAGVSRFLGPVIRVGPEPRPLSEASGLVGPGAPSTACIYLPRPSALSPDPVSAIGQDSGCKGRGMVHWGGARQQAQGRPREGGVLAQGHMAKAGGQMG